MRTYVEIADAKLRALRALAARRGFRGYARVLSEAVDEYVERHAGEVADDRAARIRRLQGSLSARAERAMRKAVREIRSEK
jgi:hypothetical protein